ncbi:MAG TPA: hypothetical protein VER75_00985, partial [Thermoleophilaceae bacterium]|nr:hypothetical protein [Thermoleophilaceae bacterium]
SKPILVGYDPGKAEYAIGQVDPDLLAVREGPEEVDDSDGVQRVTVPVREIIERDEPHRTAVFEVCDKSVSAFEVLT